MFEKYTSKFFSNLFTYGFGSLFIGLPFIVYYSFEAYPLVGTLIIAVFLFVVSYATYGETRKDEEAEINRRISQLSNEIYTEKSSADKKINQAKRDAEELVSHTKQETNSIVIQCQNQIKIVQNEADKQIKTAETKVLVALKKEELAMQLLKEKSFGFPTLFSILANYEENVDNYFAGYFIQKAHPAVKTAEVIKIEGGRRRMAEFLQRKTQSIIEYYENLAPFLLDYKEQEIDDTEEALKEYSEEEREDPATNFLTKDEYRKLSSTERNQMALERYWKRPKAKWLLGRMYERYVGYVYESKGYDVEYVGIFKGYEDLGRDLICRKGNEVIIIQCKNWSQFKTIFEKHIFQFFGTVFQYKDEFRGNKVKGIFYTTTELSPLARRFASELGIELEEKFKMNQQYPCIKCNINDVGKTKIYHLPFDQQYDNVKIEPHKGEFYCDTVEEAENKGFRRAFRWKAGGKKKGT